VEPDAGTLALYEKRAGRQTNGHRASQRQRRRRSDGNFTGAMGIPTLDGLGVRGAEAQR